MFDLTATETYGILMFILVAIFAVGISGFWTTAAERSSNGPEFEDLANAIENAWNSGQEQTIEISLSQSRIPSASGRGSEFTEKGDPEYVIYYEAFPLEEDRAWTNYVDFKDKRAQTWINAKDVGWTSNFPEGYGEFVETVARQGIIVSVSNLMVDSLGSVKLISGSDSKNIVFSWNSNDFDPLEKTMIKTRTCGDNSLCLKTLYDITVRPLNAKGLQYVELVKTGRNVPFYIASPCKATFKVYKDMCTCTPLKSYPIYSYDSEKDVLEEKGEQTVCGHWTLSEAAQVFNTKTDVPCVKVEEIDHQSGFCYTSTDIAAPVVDLASIAIIAAGGPVGVLAAPALLVVTETFNGAWAANPLSWPKHVVG